MKSQAIDSRTAAAVPWSNSHTREAGKLIIFENEVILRNIVNKPTKGKPPKREKKDIKKFSRKSRFRLLREFNRLRLSELSTGIFLTCTERNTLHEPLELIRIFQKTFLPELHKINPNLVWVYRIELHQSGHPHFHILAFSRDKGEDLMQDFRLRKIRKAWRNAIGDHSKASVLYSCKIREMTDYRKAFHYVSKYIAKKDETEDQIHGYRKWGKTKDLPVSPISEISLSREGVSLMQLVFQKFAEADYENRQFVAENLRDGYETFVWNAGAELLEIVRSLPDQSMITFHLQQVLRCHEPPPLIPA